MNKPLLEQYAQLKLKQRQIEDELDMLKIQALQEVKAISTDQPVQVGELGTFSITKKKIWQFSEEVMDLKVKVSDLETKEKQDGTAKFEEQDILVFKEIK